MPRTSFISCIGQTLSSCIKPVSHSPPEERLAEVPANFDVLVLHSGSLPAIKSIASGLCSHLERVGISVGFSGNAEIVRADVFIVILSKDFADSTDRLEELRRVHESKADLIPVFLDVRPSEVRRTGKGAFCDAFKRIKNDPGFEGWRVSFEKTALISGWKLSDYGGNSRKLVKVVVENVIKKVNSSSLQVAKHPVGLTEKIEKLERLLEVGDESSKAKVLGIVGMGGIGKTTLAKEFFNMKRTQFKASCFVEDVKGKIEKSGLERVQSLLLNNLLQIDHQIHSTNRGKFLLKTCLPRSEVILVLDNIDDLDHLDSLSIPEHVHRNSIVLITTRDRRLLECIPDSLIYDMEGLEKKYARELFCWHAFLMPHPALGFDILVEKFVTYCDGLPLSLETLGGKLFGEELNMWEETLRNVSQSLPGDIERQIRVSYDALDWFEQQIFLDIALFFIGEDKDMAVRIWNALDWFGTVGVQSLQQKCLIKLQDGRFQMHDQLKEMAAKIIDEEDIDNPGRRSRLWRPNDVMKVLIYESGSENVEGITLTTKQVEDEKPQIIRNSYGGLGSAWSLRPFAPMKELRLLILEDACVKGDFRLLSKKILWLRWRHCPSGSFPLGLPVENLRVLDLSGGKLSSLWSDNNQIPVHLEELHLQGCGSLQRLPKSIKFLNGLEKLVLSHCGNLVDLPDELCEIYALKHVDLSHCTSLHSLPNRLGNWKQLRYFNLSGCKSLESLPLCFGELEKLEHLDIEFCSALTQLPLSFCKLVEIRHLNLNCCTNLEIEADVICGFNKLEFLTTLFCKSFYLPRRISCQSCIRTLHLCCLRLTELPGYLGDLESLEVLILYGGLEVKSLEPVVFTKLNHLKYLNIIRFPVLEELGNSLGHLKQLHSLHISQSGILKLPEEIGNLEALNHLRIDFCENLDRLPMSIKELSSLSVCAFTGCSRLQLDRRAFPEISTIETLHLGNCKVSDDFFHFICNEGVSLKELKFEDVWLPTTKETGRGLTKLESLSLLSCSNLSQFDTFTGLSSVKIQACQSLKRVTVPLVVTTLQTLNLEECKNLVEICSIENLKNLKNLNISGCFDLHSISGLDKLNKVTDLRLALSDWYLFYGDGWLEKALKAIKIPKVTHLFVKVELEKLAFNLPACFQQIPQYSSSEIRFKVPHSHRTTFCGVIICFVSDSNVILMPNSLMGHLNRTLYLKHINGANCIEICQYRIPLTGSYFHVGIYMDEFLFSETSAAGSNLVLSSEFNDLICGAWIYPVSAEEKHSVGQLACKLVESFREYESLVRHYVPWKELETQKLEKEFRKMVIDMDFNGIHALGISNFFIQRTYIITGVAISVEWIGPSKWVKRQQLLFEGVRKFQHLDLELSYACRGLVENPSAFHFEAYVSILTPKRSKTHKVKELRYYVDGSYQNYDFLEKIVLSHKTVFPTI